MGFKPPKKQYKLIFEDPDMAGAEVVMRSSSIAKALEFQRIGSGATTELEKTDAHVKLLAGALIEWNLEDDDDNPLPATYDGLASLEGHVFWAIFNAWIEAVAGVPAPLDGGSTSGDSSLEASLPMEPSSPSPSS